jgi:hypothetical protein
MVLFIGAKLFGSDFSDQGDRFAWSASRDYLAPQEPLPQFVWDRNTQSDSIAMNPSDLIHSALRQAFTITSATIYGVVGISCVVEH